jgi:hypothetical protein
MANDCVYVVGWNRSVVGREKMAMELFQEALVTYGTWVKEGRIESFEPMLLNHHGGDLNGMVLLRGERAKMESIKSLDKWVDMTTRASYCIEGFGIVEGVLGAQLQNRLTIWNKIIR